MSPSYDRTSSIVRLVPLALLGLVSPSLNLVVPFSTVVSSKLPVNFNFTFIEKISGLSTLDVVYGFLLQFFGFGHYRHFQAAT